MSGDFTSSGIKDVLEYGIDLKLESYGEENYYIIRMCEYFNEKSDFKAYLSGDRNFEVEIDRSSPIVKISIRDSILTILPYVEDFFEVFTMTLGFIAKNHEKIIKDFRRSDIHKIEPLKAVNKPDEENDSDDDFEWI